MGRPSFAENGFYVDYPSTLGHSGERKERLLWIRVEGQVRVPLTQ
jgi:hypothetical protein